MMKEASAILVICFLVLVTGCVQSNNASGSSKEKACIASGGKVVNKTACEQATHFPETCSEKIGWAGCAPESSSPHKYCECGEGKCFNGEKCVSAK